MPLGKISLILSSDGILYSLLIKDGETSWRKLMEQIPDNYTEAVKHITQEKEPDVWTSQKAKEDKLIICNSRFFVNYDKNLWRKYYAKFNQH